MTRVRDAKENPDRMDAILAEVVPVLNRIAFRLGREYTDDIVQAACIRIWKAVHEDKIDLGRPETVKSYLMQAGVSGMRDEIRRLRRMGKIAPLSISVSDGQDFDFGREPVVDPEYEGVLKDYIAYIEGTGDFIGAHKAVGTLHGVSTARATTLFHTAAAKLIKELGCS